MLLPTKRLECCAHYGRSGFIAQARTGKASPRRAAAPNPPSSILQHITHGGRKMATPTWPARFNEIPAEI
jgi:hypothetical protein